MRYLLLSLALAQEPATLAAEECAVFTLPAPSTSARPAERVPSSAPSSGEAIMLPGTLRPLPAGWHAISGGLLQPNMQGAAQMSPFYVLACRTTPR